MKKSACVLGTALREDGSLLKPVWEGNEHISRPHADMGVNIAACFQRD